MSLTRLWPRRRPHFPPAWDEILGELIIPAHPLPAGDLGRLRERIREFLDRITIEGCGGQEITDEVRLLIAAYAGLLLLNRSGKGYPQLGTVLVYPTGFAAPVHDTDQHGIVTEGLEVRDGESWQGGTIVLAWDRVWASFTGRGAGLNVILHEFAHQIDYEEGISDGAPLRIRRDGCRDWHDLCRLEYANQRRNRRRGRPLVLDPYGAENAAEFFAVATETFFERPVRLKAHHPELYAELTMVYGQDPARWRFQG